MARATTSLPVPLSPVRRTDNRLPAAFPISRRIWLISSELPMSPKPFSVRVMSELLRIQSYDKGISLTDFLPDALGQAVGALLGNFRSYQHAPDVRISLPQHQPGRAVAGGHPGSGTFGVGAFAESADLDGEERGRRRG